MHLSFRVFALAATSILGGYFTEISKLVDYIRSLINPPQQTSYSPEYIYLNEPEAKEQLLETMWEEETVKPSDYWAPYITKWLAKKKYSMRLRLAEIAEDGSPYQRAKAVSALASLSLHGYEYQTLAQVLRAKTAVALARRQNVDLRFFLSLKKPARHDQQELLFRMKQLILSLNKTQRHICLKYFISKAFPTAEELRLLDLDVNSLEGPRPVTISKEDVLPRCLEALIHHCLIGDNVKEMTEAGGLMVLFDAYNELQPNVDTCHQIGRLMIKISTYPELLQHVFISGWIGVLAKWSKETEQRLNIPAACALANLDSMEGPKYGNDVVLLHPVFSGNNTPLVDVILIHGLLGSINCTWKQRRSPHSDPFPIFGGSDTNYYEVCYDRDPNEEVGDGIPQISSEFEFVLRDIPECGDAGPEDLSVCGSSPLIRHAQRRVNSRCWPRDWLPEDCKNLRLLGINYDSSLSDWLSWCPVKDKGCSKSLQSRSEKLMKDLEACEVGKRPIIWIAHSMGGLLVKHMLLKAFASDEKTLSRMGDQTKAIIFLSTPHFGSPLATLNEASKFVFLPSSEVEELRLNSPMLVNLHKDFLNYVKRTSMKVYTFVETKSMKVTSWEVEVQCVPPTLGVSGVGELFNVPVGHMDICKPADRLSFIYQKILSVIKSAVQEEKATSPQMLLFHE